MLSVRNLCWLFAVPWRRGKNTHLPRWRRRCVFLYKFVGEWILLDDHHFLYGVRADFHHINAGGQFR